MRYFNVDPLIRRFALDAMREPSPREAGRGWREAPGEGRSYPSSATARANISCTRPASGLSQ